MNWPKQAALSLLAAPGITVPFYPLMRGRAAVFMLHRFCDRQRGVEGIEPSLLRAALSLLRRRGFEFVSLRDLFERLRGEGPPLRRTVTFTIDDGYAEQAEVGSPLFAEFDCPVTTFVTTGFLDGQLWFWWDRISWVLRNTRRRSLRVEVAGELLDLTWETPAQRAAVAQQFTARCKMVPDADKLSAILRLAEEAEVPLPNLPAPEYAPMTWDQLRACESRGMSFGPHTVTHPILARSDDVQSRREIENSWARLCEQSRSPVPVFCYPNGGWADFGPREVATMRELRLVGAVVGEWGFADARAFTGTDRDAAFCVRRIPFPDDIPHLIQYVSGLEIAKLALRGSQ